MRKWFCLFMALIMLCPVLASALTLPLDTPGEQALAAYVERVNENLDSLGSAPLNSVFMCFPTLATLGITMEDDAEIPENVELTFQLYQTGLNTLQLRVSDPDLFSVVAAACIAAASSDHGDLNDVLTTTRSYASRVKSKPDSSFADEVVDQNGTAVRTYYAYYYNQYQDGVNWLQLTLIFPLYGYEGASVYTTPTPSAAAEPEDEYEGIDVKDNYTHFEVFATATPEPGWGNDDLWKNGK